MSTEILLDLPSLTWIVIYGSCKVLTKRLRPPNVFVLPLENEVYAIYTLNETGSIQTLTQNWCLCTGEPAFMQATLVLYHVHDMEAKHLQLSHSISRKWRHIKDFCASMITNGLIIGKKPSNWAPVCLKGMKIFPCMPRDVWFLIVAVYISSAPPQTCNVYMIYTTELTHLMLNMCTFTMVLLHPSYPYQQRIVQL